MRSGLYCEHILHAEIILLKFTTTGIATFHLSVIFSLFCYMQKLSIYSGRPAIICRSLLLTEGQVKLLRMLRMEKGNNETAICKDCSMISDIFGIFDISAMWTGNHRQLKCSCVTECNSRTTTDSDPGDPDLSWPSTDAETTSCRAL